MGSNLEDDGRDEAENFEGENVPDLSPTRLIEGVRDTLLVWYKQAAMLKPWPQMSEKDQKIWIDRIEKRAETLVTAVVDHVATGQFPVVHAKIDSFQIKGGEVKITAKGFADDAVLLTLNHAGPKAVKIIVADGEQFDEGRDVLNPDPDQPGLPGVKMEPGFDDDDDDQPAVDEPPIENPEGEAEAGDQVLQPKSDQWRGGFTSRMGAHKRDANPFTPGHPGYQDWFDGWDAADFDDKAPKLEEQQPAAAEPAADKPKRGRKKAGPVVEPDIAPEPEDQAPAQEQQTDGDPEQNAVDAVTDNTGTVIETSEQAYAYGVWCRQDGRGTGANPFEVTSDLGKAWLRGYSDERRAEQSRPKEDDGF